MKRFLFTLTVASSLVSMAHGQVHPPLTDSYLRAFSIRTSATDHGSNLQVNTTYFHRGGASFRERQMILLAYLKHNEAEILSIANDADLQDNLRHEKEILDLLFEKGLVTLLDDDVAQEAKGENAIGNAASNNEHTYHFELTCSFDVLLASARKLNGDIEARPGYLVGLIAVIPVLDSRYTKNVTGGPKSNTYYDEPGPDSRHYRSPLKLFKSLPYTLNVRSDSSDQIALRIY